jgi:hypothetical protein
MSFALIDHERHNITCAIDKSFALFERHHRIVAAVKDQQWLGDLFGTVDGREFNEKSLVRLIADQGVGVVRFKTVSHIGERTHITDGVGRHPGGDEFAVISKHCDHRETARRGADDHSCLGRCPSLSVRVADQHSCVVDVEATPLSVERTLVVPAVAGRAVWIDHEDVPSATPPIRDARTEISLPLVGRAPVHPYERPSRSGCVPTGVQAVDLDH